MLLLYAKTGEREWIKLRDNDIWKMEQQEDDIMPALKLSYFQLPTNLRRCFAFSSIFLKDYIFYTRKLTMYWKANGMLKNLGNQQETEDVGLAYIKHNYHPEFFSKSL